MLQADSVTFRYQPGAPLVVDDVSVTVSRGDLVGILGPNGSGKTTLLRLLAGTRKPQRGAVYLDDMPLDAIPRASG